MIRRTAPWLLAAALVGLSSAAGAAPRDKAAQKKIDEAVNTHYLNTDFDSAEGLLLGTIRACEDKCSPELVAKGWMYVGLVRGAGRGDLAGAKEAFTTALATDGNVALDDALASDAVKAAFAELKGSASPPPAEAPAAQAELKCEPLPTEMETRRPFPIQCEVDADVAAVKLHYKAYGNAWASVKMTASDGAWSATIPCNLLGDTGKLRFYVEALDSSKEAVAALGSKADPREVDVVSESSADPPALPGEEPPARCGIDQMTGGGAGAGGADASCGAWGAPCGANDCCQDGLTCNSGTCESTARCESDADCEGGSCDDGRCQKAEGAGAAGPSSSNWVSLEFALDIASISSDDACSEKSRSDDFFACSVGGKDYEGTPHPAGGGTIGGGFAPSTMRVLASYERLFGSIGAEARVGFAFGGGPKLLPVHAELRGKYWLLGEGAFSRPGFRPWIHIGGGLAQVDATVKVEIADCTTAPDPAACVGAGSVGQALAGGAPKLQADATKQLGRTFATAGGGVLYAIGAGHGARLNLNFMLPFPSSGIVVEPSIGYSLGF